MSALVWNEFAVPLGRSSTRQLAATPTSRERMAVVPEQRGRHAVTHWRVEQALGDLRRNAAAADWRRGGLTRFGSTSPISVIPCSVIRSTGAVFKTKANRLGAKPARAALAALNRQALHAGRRSVSNIPSPPSRLLFEARAARLDFLNLT